MRDMLDEFAARANSELRTAIALMFWKMRHHVPEFSVEITEHDIRGFSDCVEYLEIIPEIRIFRPQGAPAVDPVPARGQMRAIPGRPAGKPKDYVVMQMVDQDGNTFVAVENNEKDQDMGKMAAKKRQAADQAKHLAQQLQNDVQSNTISSSTILQAAEALRLLGN